MPKATQTREVDVILELFRRMRAAEATGDYSGVEAMVRQDAVLLTRAGERRGEDAVVQHLREMGAQRYRAHIVGPRGGLVSVLVSALSLEGTPTGQAHEQVYRLSHDQLAGLIDLGRVPQQVYRPESQPN